MVIQMLSVRVHCARMHADLCSQLGSPTLLVVNCGMMKHTALQMQHAAASSCITSSACMCTATESSGRQCTADLSASRLSGALMSSGIDSVT